MSKPTTTYLKDYQPPLFTIERVDLRFDLQEDTVLVDASMQCHRKDAATASSITLQGEKLQLKSIRLDQKILPPEAYQVDAHSLTVFNVPDSFTLDIQTEIHPRENTALSGLYYSQGLYCTQCEAEGFRRITYYLDRPDVLSKFSTTLIADQEKYPVLLSNGHCIEKGVLDAKRHWVKWEDPFLKPSYLFALVAGRLLELEDQFTTRSGRKVALKIYVEPQNQDKCDHAFEALKKAMRWDEIHYDREYDLDLYMIVAVNDFNMGAMENKGLNIFNAKYVLARPDTATDGDYEAIDAVIGHEYFHNWSGNRVTCRDWFQLSLKEGLTVFREQEFSKTLMASEVCRIQQVRYLRNTQFLEDEGPMAHSVRPQSYIEINNFYTTTVYEKGAEIIRMIKTIIGQSIYQKALNTYFEQYDGQAVTLEDFIQVIEQVAKRDLSQFTLWYSQIGTPRIEVQEQYDANTQQYHLILTQRGYPIPLQQPMMIPISIGLLDKEGVDRLPHAQLLILKEKTETFTFSSFSEKPILSLLRGFSAPVKIEWSRNETEWAFLLAHDPDPFNRWEASQNLSTQLLWRLVEDYKAKRPLVPSLLWLEAFQGVATDTHLDPALKAEILEFPSLNEVLQQRETFDLDTVYPVWCFLKTTLARHLSAEFYALYEAHHSTGAYAYTAEGCAARKLKALSLSYLVLTQEKKALELCLRQWEDADNMTDALGALNALSHLEGVERKKVFTEFYEKWKHEPLVIDKGFRIQALSELPSTLSEIQALMKHPAFHLKNPNNVYSLIGSFVQSNVIGFHQASGEAYSFLANLVLELDPVNPQVSARLVRAFSTWRRLSLDRQAKIQAVLQKILSVKTLSPDVFEVVSKSLASEP